ncbi:hypothetical protein P167DRAFT_223079 [Morchella conica CCBAS932]|uniref:Uncharacterized protein n=1 Tax=Morchella conica CCBAS932 TaxID=1392247 RepID=A0A3N4L096_9PEZI|nr:hypothetical protein P167DRAFT_223079 [Morchella conica CCBAS932]
MYNMVMCVVSCGLRVVGGAAAGVHMWLWWWWWCVEEGEENEEEVGEQKRGSDTSYWRHPSYKCKIGSSISCVGCGWW